MEPAGPGAIDRQVIQAYGNRRFRISATVYEGSVLVFPERTVRWPVAAIAEITVEELIASLSPVLEAPPPGSPGSEAGARPDILLIGCGKRIEPLHAELRARFREAGVAVEVMDTGAACRTYNVLVAEDRLVAAALIAVE